MTRKPVTAAPLPAPPAEHARRSKNARMWPQAPSRPPAGSEHLQDAEAQTEGVLVPTFGPHVGARLSLEL